MKTYRTNCIICDGKLIEKFSTTMPVFMGVNIDSVDEKVSKFTICECEMCGEVMVKELQDIEEVYLNNHNIEVVGNIWKEHYDEFTDFIGNSIDDKVILEISDPSAKIAKKLKNYKSWNIVEPNPKKDIESIHNVFFIKKFFDNEFNDIMNVDVIIHSHLFEHMYDPNSFLKKCHTLLKDDGIMIMSIPDMEYYLKNKYSPLNILHFEHTYFINKSVLEKLASNNGFEIIQEKKYKNHSVFIN